MKNKICRYCGAGFHFCTSCDFDFANFEGYCSVECMNEDLLYNDFEMWYNNLVLLEDSFFHKKVLQDSKEDL